MLDVCLLGTGGMMPLPYRWLTSLMMRFNGKSILIDCGEGTQIAMKEKGWSPKPIDIICFTHYHADHISGLPGMLLTMGNAERTEPLTLIGPKGLPRVAGALRTIAPELPFEIRYVEIEDNFQRFDFGDFSLEAFRVNHNVVCYGYSMVVPRAGRFQLDKVLERGIPKAYWSRLQKGETIQDGDKVYTPDMVLGEPRKGLKVTYCTDTRPTESIERNGAGADLLILEGMYGEPDKLAKAREYKHMTMYEAARIAAKVAAQAAAEAACGWEKAAGTAAEAACGQEKAACAAPELWLTHYSPSLTYPEEYMKDVRKIYPRAVAAKDGRSVELRFEEDQE